MQRIASYASSMPEPFSRTASRLSCFSLEASDAPREKTMADDALEAFDTLLTCCAAEWAAEDKLWNAEQDVSRVEWEGKMAQSIAASPTSPRSMRDCDKEGQRSRSIRLRRATQSCREANEERREAEERRVQAEEKLRSILYVLSNAVKSRTSRTSRRRAKKYSMSVHKEEQESEGGWAAALGLDLGPGLVIRRVKPGSLADEAGLVAGTQIVAVNGRNVVTVSDMGEAVRRANGLCTVTAIDPDEDSNDDVAPRSLFMSPTSSTAGCAGWYRKALGHAVNGYPVWERETEDGSRWYIYATPDGCWAVASSQFDMASNQAELRSAAPHFGAMPNEVTEWLVCGKDGEWVGAGKVACLVIPEDRVVTETAHTRTVVLEDRLGGGNFGRAFELSSELVITSIPIGSPASRAGVPVGARLVAVEGVGVATLDEALRALALITGQHATITIEQESSGALDEAVEAVSASLCPNKGAGDSYATLGSELSFRTFGDKLAEEWNGKEHDIIEELRENLVIPDGKDPLKVLAEAAVYLHHTKGVAYPRRNLVELLVLAIYTMAGPDIDALMSFEGVPVFDSDSPNQWLVYTSDHTDRNGAVFSAINWAARTAAESLATGGTKDKHGAWGTLRQWVKYTGLLLALCSEERGQDGEAVFNTIDTEGKGYVSNEAFRDFVAKHPVIRASLGDVAEKWEEKEALVSRDEFAQAWNRAPGAHGEIVARGLAGLPENVYDRHKNMKPGDTLYWPAPASCAFDPSVSIRYIRGEAANARKDKGRAILFRIANAKWGTSLQAISKYPKEGELLLPPLTALTVKKVYDGAPLDLPGVLVLDLECRVALGATSLASFCSVIRQDAARAAEELSFVLTGNPSIVTTLPVGTPVEVRVAQKGGGFAWKRATVVSVNGENVEVEYPDWESRSGIRRVEVIPKNLRVVPTSKELQAALSEAQTARGDEAEAHRYTTKELTLDKGESPLSVLNGVVLEGSLVKSVESMSPAHLAGIFPGCRVLAVDGEEVRSQRDIARALMRGPRRCSLSVRFPVNGHTPHPLEERVRELTQEVESLRRRPRVEPLDLSLVGTTISQASPKAQAAGLKAGYEVVSVDGSPVSDPKAVEDALTNGGVVVVRERGQGPSSPVRLTAKGARLGVALSGTTVARVAPDGPAAQSGVCAGWRIAEVDGMAVNSEAEVLDALSRGGRDVVFLPPKETSMTTLPDGVLKGVSLVGTTVVALTSEAAKSTGLRVGCEIQSVGGTAVETLEEIHELAHSGAVVHFSAPPYLADHITLQGLSSVAIPLTVHLPPDEEITLHGTAVVASQCEGIEVGYRVVAVDGAAVATDEDFTRARRGKGCMVTVLAPPQWSKTDRLKSRLREVEKELRESSGSRSPVTSPAVQVGGKSFPLERSWSVTNLLEASGDGAVLMHADTPQRMANRIRSLEKQVEALLEERRKREAKPPEEPTTAAVGKAELLQELKETRATRDAAIRALTAKDVSDSATMDKLRNEVLSLTRKLSSVVGSRPPSPASLPGRMVTSPEASVNSISFLNNSSLYRVRTDSNNSNPVPQPPLRRLTRKASLSVVGEHVMSIARTVGTLERSRTPSPPSTPPGAAADKYPRLGLSLTDGMHIPALKGTVDYKGLRVVSAEFPAAPALRPDDVITHIKGELTPDLPTFRRILEGYSPGSTVTFTVRRRMLSSGDPIIKTVRVQVAAASQPPGVPVGTHFVPLENKLGLSEGEFASSTKLSGLVASVEGRRMSPVGEPRGGSPLSPRKLEDPLSIFRQYGGEKPTSPPPPSAPSPGKANGRCGTPPSPPFTTSTQPAPTPPHGLRTSPNGVNRLQI